MITTSTPNETRAAHHVIDVPFMSINLFSPSSKLPIVGGFDGFGWTAITLVQDGGWDFNFDDPISGLSSAPIFTDSESIDHVISVKDHHFHLRALHTTTTALLITRGSLKIEMSKSLAFAVALTSSVAAYPSFEKGALVLTDRIASAYQNGLRSTFADVAFRHLNGEQKKPAFGAFEWNRQRQRLNERRAAELERENTRDLVCSANLTDGVPLYDRVYSEIEKKFYDESGKLTDN